MANFFASFGPAGGTTTVAAPTATASQAPSASGNFFAQFGPIGGAPATPPAPANSNTPSPTPPVSVQTAATPSAPVAPPAGTPPNVIGNPAAGGMMSLENGLFFNQADRINAAANAAATYLGLGPKGVSASQEYDATKSAIDQEQGQFAANHPIANVGASLVGGLPYGLGAGKLVAAAPGIASRAIASVASGAGLGAAYGAGADQAAPGQGALSGATVGGALGAVGAALPMVGNAARNVLSKTALENSAASRASQYVGSLLSAKGANPAAAPSVPVENGGMTVAEMLGHQGTAQAAALARQPGVAGDLATDALGTRQAGISPRLVQTVSDSTGISPTTARSTAEQLVQQGQDTVNPAYAAIRANPAPVMTPVLQNLLDTDPNIQTALQKVNAVTANAPQTPTAATWLAVRQQLADGVDRNPLTGEPLANYNNAQMGKAAATLGGQLKTDIPGFADAQAAAQTYKAPQAAYTAARGMLFGATAKQTPADVQALWDSAATTGEQQAIQHAFAADIYDKSLATTPLKPADLLSPGRQQKLAIVFGPDAAQNITGAAQNELQMQRFANRVMPANGSHTFENNAYSGSDAMQAIGHGIKTAAEHGVVTAGVMAALNGVKSLGGKFAANSDLAFKNALANELLSPAAGYAPAVASTRSIATLPIGVNAANQQASSYLGNQNQ